MSDKLQRIREKQKRRRELLAKQLGVESPKELGKALSGKLEQEGAVEKRQDQGESSKREWKDSSKHHSVKKPRVGSGSVEDGRKKVVSECSETDVYKDSSTFLKGTQSLNPHNDYCQNYVDTGQRPQNYIRDVGLADRFEEYPKLKDLNYLKDELIRKTNIPPMYLRCDLESFDLRDLGSKFEVILIQPPLEEYRRQAGLPSDIGKSFSWEDIMAMEIEEVAATRSFVFLWCGSSDGLDYGRQCLKKWGFRRCEDICWIKTNFKKKVPKFSDQGALFCRTKEHCLMGIKGTVRRSTDGDFIHANVDIDLIIDEEQELGNEEKPEEIFHLIEHFCLSRRRLHLFGTDSSIRPGWLTVGPGLTNSNFDSETYRNYFKITDEHPNGTLTGCTDEIERLRPKTPPPREKGERGGHHGSSGRGRGGHSTIGGQKDLSGSRLGHIETPQVGPGARHSVGSNLPALGGLSYPENQGLPPPGTRQSYSANKRSPIRSRGNDWNRGERHYRGSHQTGQSGGYSRR